MKYYKVINVSGWGDSYKLNHIYPESFHHLGTTIEEDATGVFKNDFKLSTKAAYDKQEGIVTKPRVKKVVEVIPSEFKVGDKVEYLGGDSWAKDAKCEVNRVYTICKISPASLKVTEDKSGYWLDKKYFKLVPKLIKQKVEIMKKQDFSIEGSKALKVAFVEECKLKVYSRTTINGNCSLTSEGMPTRMVQGTGSNRNRHFVLPQQWEEAVKYVNDFYKPEVVKPVIKIGDYVVVVKNESHGFKVGTIAVIYRISDYCYLEAGALKYVHKEYELRLATPAEIKAYKASLAPKFKMADYESSINKEAKTISFGCQTYTEKEVKLLLDAANLCSVIGRRANVTANGFTVNISDTLTVKNLETILKLIK